MLAPRDLGCQRLVAFAFDAQHVRARERVEHELARESQQLERARTVVFDERAGRREVLAQHDLRLVLGAVLGVGVRAANAIDVESLPARIVGRAQLPGAVARYSAARCGSSHAGGSMMCESASCIGLVAYAMRETIRRCAGSHPRVELR